MAGRGTTSSRRRPAEKRPPGRKRPGRKKAARAVGVARRRLYPICGYTVRDRTCQERGSHFCAPRAARACGVFEELLVHTKGDWARQPFVLDKWQRDDIIRPVFGTVVWSDEWNRYVRRYRIVWIELPRKNGKSELLAGIALILLVADDEEAAEVFGAAKDVKQARKVWDVALRMVQLSPTLSERLQVNKQEKKIYDERTGSYYEIVTSDAPGELGGNPHGIIFDEVLAQPNGDLWDALQTGMGARSQPLMVAATTAGGRKATFAKSEHDLCVRIAKNPQLAPQRFVYIRGATDEDLERWQDEKLWRRINPALGTFLKTSVLREEAREAELSPRKRNRFFMYRLNVWGLKDVDYWYEEEVWDAGGSDEDGVIAVEDLELEGRRCFGGLELSTTTDVVSLVWTFPFEDHHELLWRFFLPEDCLDALDARTGGAASQWVDDGYLALTDGDIVDYEAIQAQIEADADRFLVEEIAYNRLSGMLQLATELGEEGFTVVPISQSMSGMSPGTKELERLMRARKLLHGGNPIARWMFGNTAIREDANENIRPDPEASADNISGIKAAVMALGRASLQPKTKKKRGVAGF